MTDKELLELAAKAAGIDCEIETFSNRRCIGTNKYNEIVFDPLTDDGDALRLAVKLHIDIRHFMYADGYMDCLVDRLGKGVVERFTDDPYAATRRAIVRAAAEIGKEKS